MTYSAAVSDVNGGPGSDLKLTIKLPSQASVVSMSADRGPGCTGTTTIVCDLAWISGSLVAHVTITAHVPAGVSLTATGTVTEIEVDPSLANNSASVTVGPTPASPAPKPVTAPKPKPKPKRGAAQTKTPTLSRAVSFVERPHVAARRTMVVRLATPPRSALQIIVRDVSGRSLGSTYAVSSRTGRSLQLVSLHHWHGQAKLDVIVKAKVAGRMQSTSMRIHLTQRELSTFRR